MTIPRIMNPLTFTPHRLPGIRSFIKRNAMFRPVELKSASSPDDVVAMAHEAIASGGFQAGDVFPSPEKLSRLTGARLAEAVDAVAVLLQECSIRQQPSGRLIVARRGVI